MVSQLVKIGELPVQFELGGRWYAEGPDGGPDWGMRFTPARKNFLAICQNNPYFSLR